MIKKIKVLNEKAIVIDNAKTALNCDFCFDCGDYSCECSGGDNGLPPCPGDTYPCWSDGYNPGI